MKLNYKFSNLLGAVYRKGNIQFTNDGNAVLSPVGNRITAFDLKNNKSETLPLESALNINCIALSPDRRTLIAINEEGEAMLCSLVSKSVLGTYHFHDAVHCVKFSPDAKMFAVTRDTVVLVFHAPGTTREFNPFVLYKTFYGCYDETVSIDWTTDSQAFCVGSKDMNTRVYGAKRFENLIVYSVSGHTDAIVGSFFEYNSLNMFSVCASGYLGVWECDTALNGLIPAKPRVPIEDSFVDGDDNTKKQEKDEEAQNKDLETQKVKILYKRTAKHSYKEARGANAAYAKVTSVDYHKRLHMLVTGFGDGVFFLHDMPDFSLIHSLSISDEEITSVTFNHSGDWIGLACGGQGQLLVWEWQSETYVLKQQGHYANMSCVCYSPDAQYLVTGGDDGKVKVWNTSSGFCFVTFNEHLAGVSDVTFTQSGKVILSASLDGTVRAFDLNRYRNFRTFTSPRVAQFSCIAVDESGEIVCAGSRDTFEVFVWSIQTGRLLEILSGHEAPVCSLSFSPGHALLVSGSWDKSVKFWDVFESKGARETITFVADVLAVRFSPDGQQLAVASLDARITFWDVGSASQTGSIEGRHDIGYTRSELDEITAKKSSFGKAFTTICYSADGQCLLAGGKSKFVCIYSISDQLLLKKFEITCNMSLDSMQEFLDKRKMTEWGSLSLVDEGSGDTKGKDISLPGVKSGDMSSRHWKPEVCVTCLKFSRTGRAWSATSTEGLLVYSLDHNVMFDPFDLDIDITPATIRSTLHTGDYLRCLILSFKLNEQNLIQEVLEKIPVSNIESISQSLPDIYVDKCLSFLAGALESSAHLEFYLLWIKVLLTDHTTRLKTQSKQQMALVTSLHKSLAQKYQDISKICSHNKYLMQYLLSMPDKPSDKTEPSTDDTTKDSSIHNSPDDIEMSDDDANIEPDMLFM